MAIKEHMLPVQDGKNTLYVRCWAPENPRAIVLIAHGMAEHIARYDDFAAALNADNLAVYGCDHAGHGRSSKPEQYGYFYEQDGWNRAVADIDTMRRYALAQHPGLPVILFGHSMGSALARSYIVRYPDTLAGVILSGTMGPNPLSPIAKLIARSQVKKLGTYAPCELLNKMAFASYNKPFEPARTGFDWLSRDAAQVDQYVADPGCGFTFTATGYRDVLDGMAAISGGKWASRVPKQLPVLIFSGDRDPVGGFGKGVRWVRDALQKAGVRDVTMTLYPDGRHEMLNEIDREQVFADVRAWMDCHLAPRADA